ncbi:MAG: large conductance mechanosensitive channel protein MscL [Clostridia bacterium]|nr:large conductance mechanosensitive channel protein MscL [Clostridia bacterium]
MKKFFKEFKDFITRGNVLDMAVGIIVGGAFTAIITALVNNILNPLLAMIPGAHDETGALQVVLRAVYDESNNLDVTKSVILDFGAVITAIVTFILTAFVLFLIIKIINSIHNQGKKLAEKQKKKIEEKRKSGEITEEEAKAEEAKVEEVAAAPVETTDDLLREIRDLLKNANANTNRE